MLIVMGAAIFPHLSQKRKIGMSVLLALSIVCLYYTFTRSAWIACLIGLFAVAVIGRRRLMLGLMVGGIMVALVALPSVLWDVSRTSVSTSAAGYIELARVALQLLGRCAAPRRQGSDHRYRPQHELVLDRPGEGAAQRLPASIRRDGR